MIVFALLVEYDCGTELIGVFSNAECAREIGEEIKERDNLDDDGHWCDYVVKACRLNHRIEGTE